MRAERKLLKHFKCFTVKSNKRMFFFLERCLKLCARIVRIEVLAAAAVAEPD